MVAEAQTPWSGGSTVSPNVTADLGRHVLTLTAVLTSAAAISTLVTPAYQDVANVSLRAAPATSSSNGFRSYAQSDTQSFAAQGKYSVETDVAIQNFMVARPGADLGAIEQILELAISSLSGVGSNLKASFEMDTEETGPALFLSIDTNGMDFEEQLRREVKMREVIHQDQRLAAAKNYLVISIV